MAIFLPHASLKGPRTRKAPLPGNISPPCIQNELALAIFARHVSEKRRKSPFGNASREDLAREGPFSLHRPLESCTTRESCHSWVFRLGVAGEVRGEVGRGARGGCRRSACGLCAAPLCAGQRGVFTGSPHAASSCPRPRARCSCCRACPRVRRARCPRVMVCSFCAARSASSHARGKRIRSASLNLPASPPTCSLFSPAAPSPRPHCARSSIALSEPPPS